jgi:hypothetical protein
MGTSSFYGIQGTLRILEGTSGTISNQTLYVQIKAPHTDWSQVSIQVVRGSAASASSKKEKLLHHQSINQSTETRHIYQFDSVVTDAQRDTRPLLATVFLCVKARVRVVAGLYSGFAS